MMRVVTLIRGRENGKNGNKDKSSKSHYEMEEAEINMMGDHKEVEDEDGNESYREHKNQMDRDDDEEENAQNLREAGLEDYDAEDEAMEHLTLF
ncbi:protein CTR9 homolog [Euphorbia lathyris]|uniref:protein CTR9 homolog n=1 Tax=Euphorbia lathyris TaxID=212925 RepID=UPI00331379B0